MIKKKWSLPIQPLDRSVFYSASQFASFPLAVRPSSPIFSHLSYLKIAPYCSLPAVCLHSASLQTHNGSPEWASEPVSTLQWHNIPVCMNRMSMYLQYLVFSFLETVYDSQSIAIICHRRKQCHCATQSPATPPSAPSSLSVHLSCCCKPSLVPTILDLCPRILFLVLAWDFLKIKPVPCKCTRTHCHSLSVFLFILLSRSLFFFFCSTHSRQAF